MPQVRPSRRFLPPAVLLLLAMLAAGAPAQSVSLNQIKSAYLLKFFEYITWENEGGISAFRLGVTGGDDALFRELEAAAKVVQPKGRPLVVARVNTLADMAGTHMLYVGAGAPFPVAEIVTATRAGNTLVVTDGSSARRDFMINLVPRADGTLGFEVNRPNIVLARLKMNVDILLLGGTELDVAELVRDTEQEATRARTQLSAREQDVAKLRGEAAAQRAALEVQAQKLREQEQMIAAQNESIRARSEELAALQARLQDSGVQMAANQAEIDRSQARLDERLGTLSGKEAEIARLTAAIAENAALLARQQAALTGQEQKLAVQDQSLQQQDVTIEQQRSLLAAATVALVVFVVLTGVILYITIDRRKVNERLAAARELVASRAEELARSEKQFRTMVETIPGTVYQRRDDARWTMMYVSGEIADLTGRPAADFLDHATCSLRDLIHAEDRDRVERTIRAAVQAHGPYTLEYRVMNADGTVRWVHEKGTGVFDGQGRLEMLGGTLLDISERKRVEEQLRTHERRLSLAMAAGNLFAFERNIKAGTLHYDPRFYTALGYDDMADDACSADLFARIVYPEDAPRLQQARQRLARGEETVNRIAYRLHAKSGAVRWFESTAMVASRDTDGSPLLVAGTTSDITDRRAAEEALAQSRQRLALAMQAGKLAAWDADLAAGTVHSGSFYETLLGYGPGELPDTLDTWKSVLHPEDLAPFSAAFGRFMDGADRAFLHQYRARDKGGRVRWIEVVGTVTARDDSGRPITVIGTQQDVTEKKSMEIVVAEKLRELEEFNRLAVGRELRMIELKQEINALRRRLGELAAYDIVE